MIAEHIRRIRSGDRELTGSARRELVSQFLVRGVSPEVAAELAGLDEREACEVALDIDCALAGFPLTGGASE